MPPKPSYADLGDGAAVVEYPELSDTDANAAAVGLAGALASPAIPGLRDAIPGARTLSLAFDPYTLPHEAMRREVLARAASGTAVGSGRTVPIEVLYGGSGGPDLPELASRAGVTPEEFARRHAAGEYRVAFLGFAPGFAYLTGLEAALRAPRLATPRPRVPAGSVAIGGPYTGVYPSATPGGWRLIGRCAVTLFDEESDAPALLHPGDLVRFELVTAARFTVLERELAKVSSQAPTFPGGRPVFRIVKPGVFTSIQGAPHYGRGASGLPPGGAMDPGAVADGNARLGNAADMPALEITFLGPELEAMADVRLCLAGAPVAAQRNGAAASAESLVELKPGDVLKLGATRGGARSYLCIEGGFQFPGRLALTRRLGAGEILMAGMSHRGRVASGAEGTPAGDAATIPLRFVLDPRRERFFPPKAIEGFLSTEFRVSSTSDRRGVRLEGIAVGASGSSEVSPEGTMRGT
ncbi:MAG TPA: 5-oxoprolinase subunit PxpB, partial [Thermoanaerobaculia bacterium]|nr:5-oxoprolinase subunit PxpB [Thermoanaerobaculia bacterium]